MANDRDAQPVLFAKGALYGYCPRCGAPGEMRDDRGYDRCQNKHNYKSVEALAERKP